MILYFSGTGNSKYVATLIKEETKDQLVSINERIKNNDYRDIDCGGSLTICTPTYAWRIPRIVLDYIKKTNFINATNVYFVMTCGSEIGGAPNYNEKLCIEKKFNYFGTAQVIMPENYIAMFNAPNEKEAKQIIDKAKPSIDIIIEAIKENKPFENTRNNLYDKVLSLINGSFYSIWVTDKKFIVKDNCISCGKCVNLCPLNNIELVDGKPKWNGNCTQCMACINHCPSCSIEYGKISIGKPRYHIE